MLTNYFYLATFECFAKNESVLKQILSDTGKGNFNQEGNKIVK